jgi:hypothetical protein
LPGAFGIFSYSNIRAEIGMICDYFLRKSRSISSVGLVVDCGPTRVVGDSFPVIVIATLNIFTNMSILGSNTGNIAGFCGVSYGT